MVDALLIGTRAALAGVFAIAAAAKLFHIAGSRNALEAFGLPRGLVVPAGVALPALELTAAALLVAAPTAQAGAALAVVLLALSIGASTAATQRGEPGYWHWPGQLRSHPAGSGTAARSGVLAVGAAFVVVAGPGPGIPWWLSHASGTTVALVCVGLVTVFLVYAAFSLWHQNRLLTGRAHTSAAPVALQVGQAMPAVQLVAEERINVSATELVAEDRRTIFVFTDAGCEPCLELLPELARWRDGLLGRLDIHVLAAGDEEQNRMLASEHGLPILLDRDGAAARAFAIQATPGAVEIDTAGRVAAPPAFGALAIEGLIRAALERPAQAQGLELRYVSARPAGAAS